MKFFILIEYFQLFMKFRADPRPVERYYARHLQQGNPTIFLDLEGFIAPQPQFSSDQISLKSSLMFTEY